MRLKYIDAVKGFGMLFIMWGHIINFYEYASWWGSSFKVVIFYTVSGYLLSLRSNDGITFPKTPVKRLAATIGIPYVFYSLLSLAVSCVMLSVGSLTAQELADKFIATVTLSGISTLWFLPSMFIGRALFDALYNRKGLRWLKIIFLLLLPPILCLVSVKYKELIAASIRISEILQNIYLVLLKGVTALWFIAIGFEGGVIEGKIKEKYSMILSVCAVGAASVLAFTNRGIDLNYGDFGIRPIIFFATGTLFSLGLTGVFRFLGKRLSFPITGFIGRNSLFIMATHLPLYIVPAVSLVIDRLFVRRTLALCYLRSIIILVIVLLIEAVLIAIKNKTVTMLYKRLRNDKIKKLLSYI